MRVSLSYSLKGGFIVFFVSEILLLLNGVFRRRHLITRLPFYFDFELYRPTKVAEIEFCRLLRVEVLFGFLIELLWLMHPSWVKLNIVVPNY